jgi:hypothetical protein
MGNKKLASLSFVSGGVKSARVVLQENGLFLGIHKFILTFQRVKICPDTLSSLIAFHGKRKMALNEP